MSPENKPTNPEPVEDINKAWAMAEAKDIERQQKAAETAKPVDSTTNDIEVSLRGETLGKKIAVIRKGLLDVESRRSDSDPSAVMSKEELAQTDDTERSLQNAFYNLAKANPRLVPGLYLDSLTNYVGRKITEGQSLQDIMKNRRTDVKAHDILGQELAVLELLYRDLDITTPESEDRAWEAVVRSYDPQGKYFSPTQAIAEHGSYIDLGMAGSNFEQMLNEPDARDT